MPNIELKNIKITYETKKGEVIVIENLNAFFASGTFNVILGYSGSGKTSLLRAIIGLTLYEGDMLIDGVEIETIPVPERNFAFVSQEYVLYPHLTVFDNIALPLKMLKIPNQEIIDRVNALAEEFNLTYCLSRKPRQLSGGQQQKVALARALIKRPSVCFFDEPFSNLDQKTRSESAFFLKKTMSKLGVTVLYVTHNIYEATALADKIYVLDEQKIALECTPNELLESNHPVVQSLLKDEYLKHAL